MKRTNKGLLHSAVSTQFYLAILVTHYCTADCLTGWKRFLCTFKVTALTAYTQCEKKKPKIQFLPWKRWMSLHTNHNIIVLCIDLLFTAMCNRTSEYDLYLLLVTKQLIWNFLFYTRLLLWITQLTAPASSQQIIHPSPVLQGTWFKTHDPPPLTFVQPSQSVQTFCPF